MERPYALHDILDELNITSLDDSDVEAGLQSMISDDVASGTSDTKGSFIEEASSDSALSADVRAALAAPLGDIVGERVGDSMAALEARLRMSGSLSLPPLGPPALPVPWQQQHQLARSTQSLADSRNFQQQQSLADENAAQARELSELRRKAEAPRASGHHTQQHLGADATTAASLATSVFRLQMSDLTVSEAQYLALRARPEDELNIREWVQVRFYEARSTHKAETERLRLEVEALRENGYSTQTRAERAERQLVQREARATDLAQELERQQQQSRAQLEHATSELRARERDVEEVKDKVRRFDDVSQDAARLRQELESLREAMTAQTAAQQQLTREHADGLDKMMQLESAHCLLQKDAEAHERRARLLEETLARRDEEAAELRDKVSSLREKKRELARKVTAEQTSVTHDVREQVNVEIKRFQDQARADLEAVRTNLNALHEKEVQMLQERVAVNEARIAELQRRLDDEEHAHQELQLSAGRVRADLQNEITELRGNLKLRAFEAERAVLTHEEVSSSRQQLEVENQQMRLQIEVLRKEYYNLEVQHREGRATERAELASLKEQLRGYMDVERELDAAIRGCSGIGSAVGTADTLPPQSVDEALLLGTTLGGAPTSSQRRIQQSLLLAQEVQRRTREIVECRARLREADAETERLSEELSATKREHHYASEPQAYLLEALRRREQEVTELKRNLREHDSELERSRKQVEQSVSARLRVEEDLKQLLSQRQNIAGLQAVLGYGGDNTEIIEKFPLQQQGGQGTLDVLGARAEHRGRKPSQQSQAQVPRLAAGDAIGDPSPAWFERLRKRIDASIGDE